MPKNCISIYNEFSNIGPTRRTWTWRIKVKELLQNPTNLEQEAAVTSIAKRRDVFVSLPTGV